MQVASHRWSQARPRIDGSGLSSRVIRIGLGDVAPADRAHVERDRLVDRAGVDAGRLDAIERPELPRGLGAIHPERVLAVSPVVPHGIRVGAQVEAGTGGDRVAGRGVREAGRGGRSDDEVRGRRRADRVERLVGLLGVLQQPQVATGLEQVRRDGDRAHARAEEVRHVEAVRAAGERQRQLAVERLGQPMGEVRRHRVERSPRQVHRRVAVEDRPPVLDLEGIAQLEAEAETAIGRDPPEAPEHRDGVGVLEIVPEGGVGDRHVGEAQVVVDDPADELRAEQGGIALDRGVQALVHQQVLGDPLDLVGRAAVHRRQRDRVRQAGRDRDIADRRLVAGDDVDVRRQVGGGIGHRVEVPLDVRLQDPLEVVADAHVEEHAGRLARPAEPPVEGMDQHPRTQVLVERLVDAQLLRPLDVVALVGDVDARLVDVELVERLDRLELDARGRRRATRRRCSGPSGNAGRPRRRTACRARRRTRAPGSDGPGGGRRTPSAGC